MDEAADRISELEAQLAQARGALEDAKGAIGRLDCTVFGPILSGHAEHLGWVRDQLLDKIIRALSEEGV